MKKLFFLFIGLLFNCTVFAQEGIFYAAKFLRAKYDTGTKKFQVTDSVVFKEIFPGMSKAKIVDLLNKTPFLTDKFVQVAGAAVDDKNTLDLFKNFTKNIGGLDVTKYANTLAEVMIDRAKQELTVAFFERFKKFAKENPEFQILFPKTTDDLLKLLTYSYPQWLPTLRASFFDDLKLITYNLYDVLDLPRYQTLLKNFPEVRIAIRSLRLVHEIETGASNAADIIKEFASFPEWTNARSDTTIKSIGSCVRIAAFFSESIRANNTENRDKVWAPAKDVKELFYDELLFKLYVGLLYHKSKIDDINYVSNDGSVSNLEDILLAQMNNLFVFQHKLKEFFDLAGNVNVAFKNLQAKIAADEKPTNDELYDYIKTSIDVINYSVSIVKIFKKEPVNDHFVAVIRKSNDLYKSLYTKQYSQAITEGLDIFSMLNAIISPKINYEKLQQDTIKIYAAQYQEVASLAKGNTFFHNVSNKEIDIVAANVENGPVEVQHLLEHTALQKLASFIERVKPYALFITNMIEAKSEDEVKAAIDNAILPVGSSSVKKFTRGNISVQSYLGAFLSTSTAGSTSSGTWSDKFGVTAPIGLSLTPRFLSWKRGGAISIFLPLLDIGAIVDYKLTKEQEVTSSNPNATVIDKDYKIELGQIFSPGVYAVYGFPWNIPISLGYGAQYGPGLSKINGGSNGSNTTVTNPSWRWNFFLAVDLPLFQLVNKNKYTKTK